jgi:serine protease Do
VPVLLVIALAVVLTAWRALAAEDRPTRLSSKASLGVMVEPTPPNTQHAGVIIREVLPNSPAAKAGMKAGDIVDKIDNQEVKDFETLANSLAQRKPGDKVTIEVLRDGEERNVSVTLGERTIRTATTDEDSRQQRANAFLGIQMQELTPEARSRLGVTAEHRAIVSEVMPNTPAEKAGLKPGDVVMSVDGQNIEDPRQLREAVQKAGPGKEIRLRILRGKETKEVKARLEEAPGDVFQTPFGMRRDLAPIVPEMRAPLAQELHRLEQRVERLQKRVQELERKLDKQPPK